MNAVEILTKFNASSDSINGKEISPDKAWTELFERQTFIMRMLQLIYNEIGALHESD